MTETSRTPAAGRLTRGRGPSTDERLLTAGEVAALFDTLRPGDSDPWPDEPGMCCEAPAPRSLPPYVCTRSEHDTGQHVATDAVTVLAVWPYGGEDE